MTEAAAMTNPAQFDPDSTLRMIRGVVVALLLMVGVAWASHASGAAVLKDIQTETRPGDRVVLRLDFTGAVVPQPRVFVTEDPPRIAIDLPATVSATARHIPVNSGGVLGVTTVSAGGRTRVLVKLVRSSIYQIEAQGSSLLLVINNGQQSATVPSSANIDPSKTLPSATHGPVLTKIDFRRDAHGAGQVLVSLSGRGAQITVRRKQKRVIVGIRHVRLSASQVGRLGVLDFATPVRFITTRATPVGAHMEIAFKGAVKISSYQTGKQYVITLAAKKKNGVVDTLKRRGHPVYSGNRVTFNFQNIPVRSALQLIADVSGLNLVAADAVQGSVTLRLVSVPWDQALDVILRAKNLDKRRVGNVIWIAPQKQLAEYEQHVAAARLASENGAPLIISYIPVSYGKASAIARLLTMGSMKDSGDSGGGKSASHGFLSARGSVSFDKRTNTLLLNETAAKTLEVRKLVAKLDRPVRQVLIESRIVVATDDFERDLGVQWGWHRTKGDSQRSTITTGGFQVNLPLPVAGTSGALGVSILGKNYNLKLELAAAQTEGRGELISSPRVITANQQEATIKQGQQIGYVTHESSSGQATTSVQFKEAVLELDVTPTITADNRIYLGIKVKKDALQKLVTTPNGQVPLISTRSVNTSALVDNGQTVVLGGIYEINKNETVMKVPGLGDIPVLGALFRKIIRKKNKAELLIFVTPRILGDNA